VPNRHKFVGGGLLSGADNGWFFIGSALRSHAPSRVDAHNALAPRHGSASAFAREHQLAFHAVRSWSTSWWTYGVPTFGSSLIIGCIRTPAAMRPSSLYDRYADPPTHTGQRYVCNRMSVQHVPYRSTVYSCWISSVSQTLSRITLLHALYLNLAHHAVWSPAPVELQTGTVKKRTKRQNSTEMR